VHHVTVMPVARRACLAAQRVRRLEGLQDEAAEVHRTAAASVRGQWFMCVTSKQMGTLETGQQAVH
jgi:hypothetical protein